MVPPGNASAVLAACLSRRRGIHVGVCAKPVNSFNFKQGGCPVSDRPVSSCRKWGGGSGVYSFGFKVPGGPEIVGPTL